MKFKLDECMDVRLVVLFVNAGRNAQTVYGEGIILIRNPSQLQQAIW
jgi:hypothetical protein